jgi:hypothetical protein
MAVEMVVLDVNQPLNRAAAPRQLSTATADLMSTLE